MIQRLGRIKRIYVATVLDIPWHFKSARIWSLKFPKFCYLHNVPEAEVLRMFLHAKDLGTTVTSR